jgi:hypothetical protein
MFEERYVCKCRELPKNQLLPCNGAKRPRCRSALHKIRRIYIVPVIRPSIRNRLGRRGTRVDSSGRRVAKFTLQRLDKQKERRSVKEWLAGINRGTDLSSSPRVRCVCWGARARKTREHELLGRLAALLESFQHGCVASHAPNL